MNNERSPDSGYYTAASRKWLETLQHLKAENIRLKEQLSLTISGKVTPDFIELAERFQQHFVEKDQVIDLLRHEINTLLPKLLSPQLHEETFKRQCSLLERDITRLIYEFQQMKQSFATLPAANDGV